MNAKTVYVVLCVIGTALPVSQLIPFLREHGLDLPLMVTQLFANPISSFFGLDVIVTSVVLWVFVAIEGRRAGVSHLWAPFREPAGGRVVGVAAVSVPARAGPDPTSAANCRGSLMAVQLVRLDPQIEKAVSDHPDTWMR